MPISPYVAHLREHLGHATLLSPAASAIIRDEAGRVLLIHRGGGEGRSLAAGGKGLSLPPGKGWSLPGGGMEPGECIAGCVVREAYEETGLKVEPVRLVGAYSDPAFQHVTYPNGDQVQFMSASFECRVVGGVLAADGDESLEVAFFAPDDLPQTICPGHRLRIRDALAGRKAAFFR